MFSYVLSVRGDGRLTKRAEVVFRGDHRTSVSCLVLHEADRVLFADVTLERGEGSELVLADLAMEHALVHPRR